MRTIEFRGKRIFDNEWVVGYYLSQNGRGIDGSSDAILHFIIENGSYQMVDPETVEIKTDNKEFVNVNLVKILK